MKFKTLMPYIFREGCKTTFRGPDPSGRRVGGRIFNGLNSFFFINDIFVDNIDE